MTGIHRLIPRGVRFCANGFGEILQNQGYQSTFAQNLSPHGIVAYKKLAMTKTFYSFFIALTVLNSCNSPKLENSGFFTDFKQLHNKMTFVKTIELKAHAGSSKRVYRSDNIVFDSSFLFFQIDSLIKEYNLVHIHPNFDLKLTIDAANLDTINFMDTRYCVTDIFPSATYGVEVSKIYKIILNKESYILLLTKEDKGGRNYGDYPFLFNVSDPRRWERVKIEKILNKKTIFSKPYYVGDFNLDKKLDICLLDRDLELIKVYSVLGSNLQEIENKYIKLKMMNDGKCFKLLKSESHWFYDLDFKKTSRGCEFNFY